MPQLDFSRLSRKLSSGDSIVLVAYYDGEVTKIEKHGAYDLKIEVGEEHFIIGNSYAENFSIRKNIKGFLVEYSVPDDGATVFYFYDFYPVE